MTLITTKAGTEINLEASIKHDVDSELAEAINTYIDQLRARVADCELAMLNAIQRMPGGDAKADLRDAYDRTQAQSLAAIEARVLREFESACNEADRYMDEMFDEYVAAIEAEGKV